MWWQGGHVGAVPCGGLGRGVLAEGVARQRAQRTPECGLWVQAYIYAQLFLVFADLDLATAAAAPDEGLAEATAEAHQPPTGSTCVIDCRPLQAPATPASPQQILSAAMQR